MESNWYEQFFYGLALELWRKAVTDEQTRTEADFIISSAEVQPGACLLDIPCGNGRHSIELARRGYHMTGVDLSSEFIAEAHHAAAASGLSVDWIQADMQKVHLRQEFDAAFCFGNSFGYMHHEDTIRFLNTLTGSLKPGARFILDTGLAAESLLPNFQNRRWFRSDDLIMLSEMQYDASESHLHTHYTFFRDGVIQTGTATYSVYTVAELKRLLSACGLNVLGLYGSTNHDLYKFGSPRLLLIAEREPLRAES